MNMYIFGGEQDLLLLGLTETQCQAIGVCSVGVENERSRSGAHTSAQVMGHANNPIQLLAC